MPKDKIAKPYDLNRSWNYVLWLLGRQSYTKAQLQKRLERKGASPDTIKQVIARLERYRYVDDALYAQNYIRARRNKKGILALKQELFQKGVPEHLIGAALDELGQDEQIEAALALLKKQIWRFKGDERQRKAKAYAYLVRRGYPADIVREVLEQGEFFEQSEDPV